MMKTTNQRIIFPAFINPASDKDQVNSHRQAKPKFDLLQPLRQWLDELEIATITPMA